MCLDIEDMEEELIGEFEFEMRKEWDDIEEMKRNLGNKIDPDQNDLLCRMFDEKTDFFAMILKFKEVNEYEIETNQHTLTGLSWSKLLGSYPSKIISTFVS